MKQLLFIATLLLTLQFKVDAQTITNNTACDIEVTPICYDPNGYPGNCVTMPGTPIIIAPFSTIPLPTCAPPTVTVAYQVCWRNHLCPYSCVTVDAGGGAAYPACAGSWPWAGVTAAVLPQCADCAQPHGGTAKVVIDAAGNIKVN